MGLNDHKQCPLDPDVMKAARPILRVMEDTHGKDFFQEMVEGTNNGLLINKEEVDKAIERMRSDIRDLEERWP
jgi:hypothetical protein